MHTATHKTTSTAISSAGTAQLLKMSDVQQRTRLSRSSIYAFMAAGKFPKAVKLGSHSRWLENEVEEFIHRLADARA